MATDWRAWHGKYDDPQGSLARRLSVVRRHVADTLAGRRPGLPTRVLSLCSGDGRDLLPVIANCDHRTADAVLVEQDPTLAQDARTIAQRLGLGQVSVITGDAGQPAVFCSFLPVDLLMLCGIFGNISASDITRTITAAPSVVRPGGTVIWTRGSTNPDLRSVIRRQFIEAGFSEVAFESERGGFGVGVARLREPVMVRPLPHRLFTFLR